LKVTEGYKWSAHNIGGVFSRPVSVYGLSPAHLDVALPGFLELDEAYLNAATGESDVVKLLYCDAGGGWP